SVLQLADHLLYETRLVIDEMVPQLSEVVREDVEVVHGLFLKKQGKDKTASHFSEDFLTNLNLLGLHERKNQTAFAHLVEKRL
ncbi:hypothetical protein RFF58_10935, partial [Streptococcus ruminantium]|nr:hypothetical protein [Streptococcus ruminantium]